MAKKTKKEKEVARIAHEINGRGNTFIGFRPSIMKTKKGDKKTMRRENKAMCRNMDY
jgi:hypothetical protein